MRRLTEAMRPPGGILWQLVQLQVGWFACVLGAAHQLPWVGPVVVGALLVLHWRWSDQRRDDLVLILAAGAFGFVADSAQAAAGWLRFEGSHVSWLSPPWIVALWLQMGTARHGLLGWLGSHLPFAPLVGGVGGPLAYLAGARLGAAELLGPAVVSIAAVWAVFLTLAALWVRRPGPTPRQS